MQVMSLREQPATAPSISDPARTPSPPPSLSSDDHDRFRGSAEYQRWKALLHHFYDPFHLRTIRHRTATTGGYS